MIRMSNELKEELQNQLKEFQENKDLKNTREETAKTKLKRIFTNSKMKLRLL
jgi:hypothetical protein